MCFTFRLAHKGDLDRVCDIIKAAVEAMDNSGIHQWDSIYPSREDLKRDIKEGQLYVCSEGITIASLFVLNSQYDPQYDRYIWSSPDFIILHRLCVDPVFQGRGIGSKTLRAAEECIKNMGIASLRLDAFSLNPAALKMYEKNGYVKRGEADLRMGKFYLYEKLL